MFINWEALRKRGWRHFILDLFMITIALVNIMLISFDYTYISFRNFYYHNIYPLVELYDPVKGIEPHRFTEKYLNKAEIFFNSFEHFKDGNPQIKSEMIDLSNQMIEEDPFERAQKSGDLEIIKERVRKYTGLRESSKQAFIKFWQVNAENHKSKEKFFNESLKPIIQTNYWRRIDKSGNYVDYFFYIDLIFVIIFLSEFLIMWRYSVKKLGSDQKIIYPLYHWYDVVSCIPLKEFRFLRLFRFLSVYLRLINSDIIKFGNGPIHRIINRYKDIIAEEISDKVSVQILSDIQEKTKLGTNRTIIEETIKPYKSRIRDVLVANIKKLEVSILEERQDEWVEFISSVAEDGINASPEYQKLKRVPYLNSKLDEYVNSKTITKLVDQSMTNFNQTLNKTLNSEEGHHFLGELIDDVIEEIFEIMRDETIQELIEDINLQLLEELKKGSTAKKWKVNTSDLQKNGVIKNI